jgi:hypothetical protein
MKCELCNSNTMQKKVRKQHWFNGSLYIVEMSMPRYAQSAVKGITMPLHLIR